MSTVKNSNKKSAVPEYKSRYSDAVKSNLSSVLEGKKFNYDIGSDKLFHSIRTAIRKPGRRLWRIR